MTSSLDAPPNCPSARGRTHGRPELEGHHLRECTLSDQLGPREVELSLEEGGTHPHHYIIYGNMDKHEGIAAKRALLELNQK